MHITGQLTFATQKVTMWRQTIPGTRINTDDLGRGRQYEGDFPTSSVKRLNVWTCANGHKIIMKGACKAR